MKSTPSKLIISFDFELGWGVLESENWRLREKNEVYTKLRLLFPQLIRLFRSYEIKSTWAIVSSLANNSISSDGFLHLPKQYQKAIGEFYSEAKNDTKCADDLLAQLKENLDLIEIATHTSTHINADYPELNKDSFVTDVELSIKHLSEFFNKNITSIVFPLDQSVYKKNIAPSLVKNVRLNPSFGINRSGLRGFFKKVKFTAGYVPPSKISIGENNEVYHRSSMFFNWKSDDRFNQLRKTKFLLQKRKLLNLLESTSNVYHIWLHPFNLSVSDLHFNAFEKFLKEVNNLKKASLVEVITMSDLSDQIF